VNYKLYKFYTQIGRLAHYGETRFQAGDSEAKRAAHSRVRRLPASDMRAGAGCYPSDLAAAKRWSGRWVAYCWRHFLRGGGKRLHLSRFYWLTRE